MENSLQDLIKCVDRLRDLPAETEWLEFKSNHQSPEHIGECISALANSACLHQVPEAYLIFGVDNVTHEVVETSFDPAKVKAKGAEDLEIWLNRNLHPAIEFRIVEVAHPQGRIVVFFIEPAHSGPVRFKDKALIRIGSNNTALQNYPDKEAIIWDRRIPFEAKIAKEAVAEADVFSLLDTDSYFSLLGDPVPTNAALIVEKFLQEGFLTERRSKLSITNLGAILLAKSLKDFERLRNKSARIITYKGLNRLDAIKDVVGQKGYGTGFTGLIKYIQSQIPEHEVIQGALRVVSSVYPVNSIREFVANALVHQDFSILGAAPLIEIFSNRIEISNPGAALIDTDRFIDHPPKSRNERLSDMLRRMKICEKRGSGVDRAISAIEMAQLPPPKIESVNDAVRVILYSNKELGKLTKEEQCRACYYHSCLRYVLEQDSLTNASLCKRLGIEDKNKAIASRIIKATLELKWIKPFDPSNVSNKYAKYVPYWV